MNVFVALLFYSAKTCESSICWSLTASPSYVLTLHGHNERVPTMIYLFRKYANLNLRSYYGINGHDLHKSIEGERLLPGELGLRSSMEKIYTMAVKENYNDIFVFEDDAVPHRNFTQLFRNLPQRCREADILLLGALVYSASRDQWPFGPCFDADERTFGAHGLYVKNSAFKPILEWLMEIDTEPFDHMYKHLMKQGIKVRVAHPPFLVIQNLNHNSSVDPSRSVDKLSIQERAYIHNWNLEDYPTTEILA
jgi:hypothetical protein